MAFFAEAIPIEEKTMRISPLTAALVFLLFAPANAQSMRAPKPDFAPFNFMLGSWSCRTTRDPDAATIGRAFPFVVAADPGGYRYVVTTPHAKRYLMHDAATATWVTTALTTDGASYSDRSTGWSGDAIVFTDAFASDGSALGSTTIRKIRTNEFTLHSVEPGAKGTEISDQTCTKS